MNLLELIQQLPPTDISRSNLPSALLGAFRRKSISFFNGLTDEKTIVYWFQSATFTIDLRLKSMLDTPVLERQGWIGDTLWDDQQELLSWQLSPLGNFQNHVQWPEPAKLHAIGNCLLEFSPSNVYVEDWRQQAQQGLYLGLKLYKAVHVETQDSYELTGGLIICDQFMAYAQSRFPDQQSQLQPFASLAEARQHGISNELIEAFEVSIALQNQQIQYSTQSHRHQQSLDLDHFEQVDERTLKQRKWIQGQAYDLFFERDVYQPDYQFQMRTETPTQSKDWFLGEQDHLACHAQTVF